MANFVLLVFFPTQRTLAQKHIKGTSVLARHDGLFQQSNSSVVDGFKKDLLLRDGYVEEASDPYPGQSKKLCFYQTLEVPH